MDTRLRICGRGDHRRWSHLPFPPVVGAVVDLFGRAGCWLTGRLLVVSHYADGQRRTRTCYATILSKRFVARYDAPCLRHWDIRNPGAESFGDQDTRRN